MAKGLSGTLCTILVLLFTTVSSIVLCALLLSHLPCFELAVLNNENINATAVFNEWNKHGFSSDVFHGLSHTTLCEKYKIYLWGVEGVCETNGVEFKEVHHPLYDFRIDSLYQDQSPYILLGNGTSIATENMTILNQHDYTYRTRSDSDRQSELETMGEALFTVLLITIIIECVMFIVILFAISSAGDKTLAEGFVVGYFGLGLAKGLSQVVLLIMTLAYTVFLRTLKQIVGNESGIRVEAAAPVYCIIGALNLLTCIQLGVGGVITCAKDEGEDVSQTEKSVSSPKQTEKLSSDA